MSVIFVQWQQRRQYCICCLLFIWLPSMKWLFKINIKSSLSGAEIHHQQLSKPSFFHSLFLSKTKYNQAISCVRDCVQFTVCAQNAMSGNLFERFINKSIWYLLFIWAGDGYMSAQSVTKWVDTSPQQPSFGQHIARVVPFHPSLRATGDPVNVPMCQRQ